jgi:hypothetical protein
VIEGWTAGRAAEVAGTAQGIVAEAVLRSEDEDLGLERRRRIGQVLVRVVLER